MAEWELAQNQPSERLAQLHFFSMIKKQENGEIEFRIGDEPHIAGPGTFVASPTGTVHGFRHAGPEPISFLNLHAPPGGFIDRLRAD